MASATPEPQPPLHPPIESPTGADAVRQADAESNYPYFREFVLARLREEFQRTLPELPDKDLEALATEEQAQPLEEFIAEFEREEEG